MQVFGAGQYAMRFWVKPDQLAKLNITVNDLINAINAQNTVNPAGQVGGPPTPKGQEFTYTITAQSRLVSEKEFGDIVVRENPDGSMVRLKDVARVELGAQLYNIRGQAQRQALGGPGHLPIARLQRHRHGQAREATSWSRLKARFPADLEYGRFAGYHAGRVGGHAGNRADAGDRAGAGHHRGVHLPARAGARRSFPLLAVPVSLIGTFAFFPLFGFSINTLSLLGLVLAIGLVVDDAIIVVEATERHIEEGLSPKEAAIKAMDEVAGPVVALALILVAVFVPTVFISGITGRLYQQFAVTIAISVALSAFNALSLSPALAALLLRPRERRRQARPAAAVLRLVQPGIWQDARALPAGQRGDHSPQRVGGGGAGRRSAARRCCSPDALAHRVRAGGGPGLCLCRRPSSPRRLAGPHRRRGQADREHPDEHARRGVLHDGRGVQPAQPGPGDLQCVLLRHAQAVERTQKGRRTVRRPSAST